MVFSAHYLRSCVGKHRLQALQFQFLEFSGAKKANVNPSASNQSFTPQTFPQPWPFILCVCVLGLHGHWWERTLDAQEEIYLPTWLKTLNIKKHFLDTEVEQYHLPVCRTVYALPKIGEKILCTATSSTATSLPVLVLLLLKQKCWMMAPEKPVFMPPFFCKQRIMGTHSAPNALSRYHGPS